MKKILRKNLNSYPKLSVLICCIVLLTGLISFPGSLFSNEVRIGDLARVHGTRMNQITGFGLVVGLNNTGDRRSPFTEEALSNYLNQLGVDTKLRPKLTQNVASVMVVANIPSWVKPGDRVDVIVSSIGDARSLEGGVLLQSPLKAGNGEIIAVASGSLQKTENSSGKRRGGYSKKQNTSNSAMVPLGGIVEKGMSPPGINSKKNVTINKDKNTANETINEGDTPSDDSSGLVRDNSSEKNKELKTEESLKLILHNPSYSTMNKMSDKIKETFGDGKVQTVILNARELEVSTIGENSLAKIVNELENIKISVETPARIVINEKTGTVVMGGNLVMDEVAISKTGLKVNLESHGKSRYFWTETEEKEESVFHVKKINNVKTLVDELNRLGANTQDVIAILQSLKKSGILHAEVIVQ